MKRTAMVLAILVLLGCPRPSGSQDDIGSRFPPRLAPGGRITPQDENVPPFPFDRAIAPRPFKKTLPPLNKKEKVTWAFRTANANIFL